MKEQWRSYKEKELNNMDTVMVRRYAVAIAEARKYNVRNTWVARAINKLAYYTDIVGDEKMKEYVTSTTDPITKSGNMTYTDQQYVQTRPGLTAVPAPDANAEPSPAAP